MIKSAGAGATSICLLRIPNKTQLSNFGNHLEVHVIVDGDLAMPGWQASRIGEIIKREIFNGTGLHGINTLRQLFHCQLFHPFALLVYPLPPVNFAEIRVGCTTIHCREFSVD
jgi:hypothetical protein